MSFNAPTLMRACLTALSFSATIALAQYPAKPINVIVPYPPGGATDILARKLAGPLSQRLGQPVIVDNRPGGNTVIGHEALLRLPPDGHAFVVSTPSFILTALAQALGLDWSGYGATPTDCSAAVPRVFAAGTIMAANVLRHGYLAGFGVTLAAVHAGRYAEAVIEGRLPEMLEREPVLIFVVARLILTFAATYMLFTPQSRAWFARTEPPPEDWSGEWVLTEK